MTNYKELTQEMAKYVQELKQAMPEVLNEFFAMAHAANKAAALSTKQKELIAIAIGVANRCDGCIGAHMKTLIQLGMTREELIETLGVAIYMGGGPALMYAANALKAFEELSVKK